jgi:hypothetical protein
MLPKLNTFVTFLGIISVFKSMILSAKSYTQESKIRENFADDRLLNSLEIRRFHSKKVKAKLERISTSSREK